MIKKIAAQIKEYKKVSIITPIFMAVEVAMEILIPILMASIIDNGVKKSDMNYILKTGGIMLLVVCVSLTAGVLSGRFAAIASAGLAKNLRKALFRNVQEFSFSNIDKFSTAGLITRMTTDVTNVQNSYQMILRMCARAPLMLIFAMIMVFRINPNFSLMYLGVLVVIGTVFALIIRKAFPMFQAVFEKYDALNTSVQENIGGIRVVKAYVREDFETQKFKKASKFLYDLFIKAEKIVILNQPVMILTIDACKIMLSWFGAHMIISGIGGSLTTGQLMSLFTYSINILNGLMMLSMIFVMLTLSKANAARIAEVLDEKSDITNKANPVREVSDGSISFENVNFLYSADSDKPVLSDIDLSIKSGETVGIIGGTGSGKSTLVQLIPRLYDVSSGSVKVGGTDVRDYDIESLRLGIAMVMQKNILFSGTIRENLLWGNQNATDEQLDYVCRVAQIEEFIKKQTDGYETRIERGGTNVSGGQKQRLCIARALLKYPKVIIFDDSTSAVDTKTDAMIRDALKKEMPDATKIIISQRVASVEDADKIIVLDDGKINGFGTPKQMLETNEIYQEIHRSQERKAGA